MNKKFLEWIILREKNLKEMGIDIEIADSYEEHAKNLVDPVQTVYFYTNNFSGKVSVWNKGQMDIEVLNNGTENIDYYKYYENIELNIDFDKKLSEFIKKVNT